MPAADWVKSACFALIASSQACGAERDAAPPAQGAPKPAPASSAVVSAPPRGGPQGDEVVAQALRQVAAVRELAPRGPVRGRIIPREQMMAFVERQLRTAIPAEVVSSSEEVLFSLGIVEAGFDYEVALKKLLGQELAGFYDPEDKTMYLGEDLDPAEREATLWHELVHALQDQHYDLERLMDWREDESDFLSAVHALAEGDATSAMLDTILAPSGRQALDVPEEMMRLQAGAMLAMSSETADIPGLIKRSILAPYMDGLEFVHWLRRRQGWKEVDAAWKRLPLSTEQLLHPEKWLAQEKPEIVGLPTAHPLGPTKLVYHDVMGEQSLRILFEEWMPAKTASDSARDWAGDRIGVFADGARYAIAWHLRFDHKRAAELAASALARGVLQAVQQSGAPDVTSDRARAAIRTGEMCRERSDRGPFGVMRSGRDVVCVAGPYLRSSTGTRSDGQCRSALDWARQLAK